MSDGGDDNDPEYRVGRGNPPKEHRFPPGVSGNALGRPPKNGRSVRRPLEQPAEDIILGEAYRPVTLNDGGKSVTMPAIQAVARAQVRKAIKGNAQAQKALLERVLVIERKFSEDHAKLFGEALAQKAALERERQQWVGSGRDEGDMLLHPDDLEICLQSGNVRNFAPMTEEAMEGRRKALVMQEECVTKIARSLKARQLGLETQQWKIECELAEKLLQMINELLPPRHRKELGDIEPEVRRQL
jgi:hypothetical protein